MKGMRTFRLEITVNEPHEMQVLQGCDYLRGVEPRAILGQALSRSRLKCAEKLASHAILHAKVKVPLGLEGVIQSNNERVVGCCKYFLLGQRALDLFPFNHFFFGQDCGSTSSKHCIHHGWRGGGREVV